MMDGGEPFDAVKYRNERAKARLADKGYQRHKKETEKSHEINKIMITLKDGTDLTNIPIEPGLFSGNRNPKPNYKLFKDVYFIYFI